MTLAQQTRISLIADIDRAPDEVLDLCQAVISRLSDVNLVQRNDSSLEVSVAAGSRNPNAPVGRTVISPQLAIITTATATGTRVHTEVRRYVTAVEKRRLRRDLQHMVGASNHEAFLRVLADELRCTPETTCQITTR